jgi:hypothetical protein
MVIDENDAFQLFQGIDTMPEDMRPRAASLLADYRAQQETLGAPLWPTQEKLKQDRKKRVQEVFQNPLVLDTENAAFVEANRAKPGFGDQLRAREASILWLADRYNADEADVRKRYDFYKADASQKWGNQPLDDSTFFSKAKSELDADMVRAEKRKQSALTGMESALSGATMASELARFQESYPDATEEEKVTFADSLFQTSVALAPHRRLIDAAAPAMRRIQQGKATDEDRQTVEQLTWTLAQSQGRDRNILIRSLLMGAKKVAEEGGKRDVSGTFAGSAVNIIDSMFGAGRRGEEVSRKIDPSQPLPIAEPITSVEDALKVMDTIARAEIASRVPYDPEAPKLPAARVLSEDEKAFVMEAKERAKSLFKAERELKKIALSTDPMDDSILGTMASGTASSLSLMLPLAMGPQGLLMAGGGYANLEREELLTEFPDMNPEDAATISVLSGAAQAAMDKATLFGLGKFAPNVRKMIMGGVTKELAKKAAAQGGALFAFENTVEAAQDLSTSVIQEMVSELSQSVPQVDWQKEKEEFLGTRADVAIGMVPLMLIGAGVNTAANKQQVNDMLADNDLLMRAGIIESDRVKILELATAGKTNEAEAALKDAMGRRSPELAAEVAEKYASKLDALRKVQDQAIALQDTSSPEYTVDVTRSPQGWQVRTGDGNVVTVDSAEAARRIAVDLRQVGSQQEADALVNVIDDYYAAGRQAETVITGETVKVGRGGVFGVRRDAAGNVVATRAFDAAALETIRKEAEVAGINSGTQDIFAHVNGGNDVFPMRVADTAKGVARVLNLYKSQAEGQPQVITFLHENIESSWRLGMANGTFSEQETRTAMRALLPAFEASKPANSEEGQFIENLRTLAKGEGNETMLRETVSEMVIRDVLGRDRQGRATGMRPGSISRAIEAAVMGAKTQAEASAFRRILAMFRAFSAYLKGVFGTVKAIVKARDEGKIGEEWDTFVNKVLGIDEVKQMEQAAVEEAQEILDAGNMAFSVSKGYLGTVANGEVIAVKVPDLSKAQHADFREIATEDDAKDFRFNPTDGVVYWWNPAKVSDEERQKVADHLEALGQTVNAQKGIKASSANYAAAHGTFSISRVTPAQDAEYLELAKNPEKNRTLLQKMVDAVAKAAGFNTGPVWHYGPKGIDSFQPFARETMTGDKTQDEVRRFVERARSGQIIGTMDFRAGTFFTPQRGSYASYGPQEYGVYLKIENAGRMVSGKRTADIKGKPIDALMMDMNGDGIVKEIAIIDPAKIKSADPVTYDNAGNVIPLSQRFNPETPNINFSISPIRNLNELSDQVERQFAENPAGALEVKSKVIHQFAKLRDKWSTERWTPKGDKIRPISEKRTVKSLDREQAYRKRARQRELIDEGMMKLPPATLMAWSEGVGTLEDHPFVKHMLNNHGRLMSESTAERMGKLKTDGKGNAGDYNDAGWIPPNWYSGGPSFKTVVVTFKDGGKTVFDIGKIPADIQKQIDSGDAAAAIKTTRLPSTGGIMPNEMAQAMYDDGLLKTGALAPDLWAELDSIVKSHRSAKEGYAKAEKAVRDVEKKALEQATKEAQAWRDETDKMQNEDWSPRESLVRDLITLEAIVAMFPAEIRGKIGGFVTLARKASESARLKVLQKQLERGQRLLEKHLKDQYGEAVDKLLERYKSQKDKGGRISGKILSTATEQVDYAAEFIELDIASQAKEQAALEKQVEESESAEDVQDALTKLGIARLFEVWDTKDSTARESAFLWLNETIEQGKQGKKLLDEERKAFLDDMRQDGQASILAGDELNAAIADNITNLNKGVMKRALLGMRGVLSEALWTTLQRLELIFGEDSKTLDYFAGKIINAANLSTDIKRLVESQKKDALTVIFNSDSKFAHARGIAELQKIKDSGVVISRVTKEKVTLDIDTLTKLADGTMDAKTAGLEQVEVEAALEEFASNARKRTVTIEKVTSRAEPTARKMSEAQGIQWWLWSMQDASRKQMERDGWDADSFEQLEKFLSPEAKALGRWIAGSYQDAAGMIDPIYRRLFNAPLPRIKNYSPIHRRNMNAGGEVMDMESSDMNSGLAAGFTKSRVNTTASLVESDALAVFLAHWENVSHWVAHAELIRDMKAVLLDKDTAVAIRQKKSEGYLQRLKQDISTIEKNGTNNASELVNMSRVWRWFMQYRAYKGLAFRLSPIIKQTPALLNPLLADVPAHNYMMGMARAFVEPQTFAREVSAMWKSDIIRRRIEQGFSAESRIATQGSSMTGSQAILAMQAGMMPMSAVDGGWTALGAAISFDFYRRGYISQGMTPEMADNAATARVEKMIATSAQPADVYARALYERNGNPFMRSMSMFVSDQRKALAIELMAIRRLATGKSKNKMLDVQRALVAHVVQAGVSQVMAVVIASLLGDDEDRDRELSREQWTLALTLGPINGLFVFGRLIDKLGRGLLGLRVFPADDLASKAANDLLKGGKNMDELFSPDNPEEFMDALDSLSTAAAAGMSAAIGPAGGAADVGANLIREFRKIQERLSE